MSPLASLRRSCHTMIEPPFRSVVLATFCWAAAAVQTGLPSGTHWARADGTDTASRAGARRPRIERFMGDRLSGSGVEASHTSPRTPEPAPNHSAGPENAPNRLKTPGAALLAEAAPI